MDRDKSTDADLRNSEHWRALAEQTREKANAVHSPDIKERMLEIAAEYDRLADQIGPGEAEAGDRGAKARRVSTAK